ncbi:hypothetical protein ABPG74_010514 [Tetrahymena malaccensis]
MGQLSIFKSNPPANTFTKEEFINFLKEKRFKKIIVLTGAGISTNAGIPDFRSKDTGLYARLKRSGQFSYPEQIFTIDYYQENHKPFYEICREFVQKEYEPQQSHKFITELAKQKTLYLNITQNIDGLELKAGLDKKYLIQAHGNLEKSHCIECHKEDTIEYFKEGVLKSDDAVICRKTKNCQGKVKPSVTFFGEKLPLYFYKIPFQMKFADLVIVMGTSLKVQPFASLLSYKSKSTPLVVLNNENVVNDCSLFIGGDIDKNLQEIMQELVEKQN